MADFETAVKFVLASEGGLEENPNDNGGITNFGISLRFLREVKDENLRKYGIFGVVNENTIRQLVIEQAKIIYRGEFWEENGFEEICVQNLCNYLFDMAVNHGVSQAVKLLQRSVCASAFVRGFLHDDGIMGTKTLDVANLLGDKLLPILVALRVDYCRYLVEINPKNQANLDGWLNRCYAVSR